MQRMHSKGTTGEGREGANRRRISASALSTNAAREGHVLRHDCDPLGVDGGKIHVLEEADDECLAGLLQGAESSGLNAEVVALVQEDVLHQPLEWHLADKELGALLVPPNLTEGYRSGLVPMGLLDTTSGGNGLLGGLGSELCARRLASRRSAGGLFPSS